MKYQIKPVFIEKSQFFIGRKPLRKFQFDLIKAEAPISVLDAPTGAGKTFAAFSKCLDLSPQRSMHDLVRIKTSGMIVFIYPTNELIRNQFIQFEKYCEDLGLLYKNVNSVLKPNLEDKDLSSLDDIPVRILEIDGLIWKELFEKTEKPDPAGKIILNVLKYFQESSRSKAHLNLILTNVDFIKQLNKACYFKSSKILDKLKNIKAIVIDEFHLYTGIMGHQLITNLFPFIISHINQAKFRQELSKFDKFKVNFNVIFMSATHGEGVQLLQDSLENVKDTTGSSWNLINFISTEVKFNPRPNWIKIRHRTNVELVRTGKHLFSDASIEKVIEQVQLLFKSSEFTGKRQKGFKLVIILNSIIFAQRLYNSLKQHEGIRKLCPSLDQKLCLITGWTPFQERRDIQNRSMKEEDLILIGTSAIEVGIDFDTPFLIFEGTELNSFIQRFGRGGRHQQGHIIIFSKLAQLAITENTINLQTFFREIEKIIAPNQAYFDFIFSKEGFMLYLSDFLSSEELSSRSSFKEHLDSIRGVLDEWDIVKFRDQSLKDAYIKFIDSDSCRRQLLRHRGTIAWLKENMGARGSPIEGVVYNIITEEREFLDRKNILELLKKCLLSETLISSIEGKFKNSYDYTYLKKEFIRGVRIKEEDTLVTIHGLSYNSNISFSKSRIDPDKIKIPSKHEIILHRPDIFRSIDYANIEDLFNNIPIFISSKRISDWRIPFLRSYEGNFYLYIGADALLVSFLREKQVD